MSLYEPMPYKVLKRDGKIETRKYDDLLLASTKTQKNKNRDSGFSNVFRYISGDNKERSKISMTTPVVSYEEDDHLVTGFYISRKYTKDNVPKPSDDQVFIKELQMSLYAVISFRGRWTDKNFDKHDQILLQYINKQKYKTVSPRLIFRYQPPFVPAIFRRNEIAYQIM